MRLSEVIVCLHPAPHVHLSVITGIFTIGQSAAASTVHALTLRNSAVTTVKTFTLSVQTVCVRVCSCWYVSTPDSHQCRNVPSPLWSRRLRHGTQRTHHHQGIAISQYNGYTVTWLYAQQPHTILTFSVDGVRTFYPVTTVRLWLPWKRQSQNCISLKSN